MNYRNTFIVAACAASTCLFNSLSAFGVEAETIEAIEVVGHHNSLLITAEVDLSQSSTPDMRGQLQTLPGLHINGNGAISGVLQYRGLFGDRIRINIDGAEIAGAGPNAMDSPLSHVMATLYQQVTLHQGIAPVSVGAETIAGALEVDEYQFAMNSQDTWQTQGLIRSLQQWIRLRLFQSIRLGSDLPTGNHRSTGNRPSQGHQPKHGRRNRTCSFEVD